MRSEPPRLALPIALAVAILAVSTASILIRLAQTGAPSISIAALRLGIATACLAPIALLRHGPELRSLGRRELALAFLSGAFLAVHFATWITSLEYTTVASSVVLVSTGPLWVGLLSPLVLRERMAPATILGLAFALLGGLVIASGGACTWHAGLRCAPLEPGARSASLWGNLLALAGAWAVSGYLVIGRRLRPRLSLIPYIFLVYGCAAVVLLIVAVLAGAPITSLSATTYLWIVLLALVPQLIGHSTYNWALRYLPAALVAVTTLGEPIGSAILAFIILKEEPAAFVLAGAVLVLAGIYLAARGGLRVAGKTR